MFNTGVLNQYKQRSFIAFGSAGVAATIVQIPFSIPREARFISFMLVGAGGGGAGGASGSAGTSRRGGGGGGGGCYSSAIISTRSLPGTVYLNLAGGGTGGNGGGSGAASIASYISSQPVKSATNAIILGCGGASGGSVSGTGGTGGSFTALTSLLIQTMFFTGVAGLTGTASGNASATGSSLHLYAIGSVAPGGGSTNLGTPFAGGSFFSSNAAGVGTFGLPIATTILPGGANTGADGVNGFHNLDNCTTYADAGLPLYSLPGSGGGAINSGTGGNGGNGAPGCGGGGGGAGTTGGRGGNGGPAFCIVEWW
jgi:hypothetical protein